MTHQEPEPKLDGVLLRVAREARGWTLNDMAVRSCMSVNHIRQIEEGGLSSFYSPAVKATAAKKVAAILGVSQDQLFQRHPENPQPLPKSVPEPALESEPPHTADAHGSVHTQVVEVAETADLVSEPASVPVNALENEAAAGDEPVVEKNKSSLWAIGVLFVTALAVAAWMRPETEPAATESMPAVQVVPAEADDPASAASAASLDESSATAMAKPASASAITSASAPASTPVPGVSKAP